MLFYLAPSFRGETKRVAACSREMLLAKGAEKIASAAACRKNQAAGMKVKGGFHRAQSQSGELSATLCHQGAPRLRRARHRLTAPWDSRQGRAGSELFLLPDLKAGVISLAFLLQQ